jgi:hypothetical protein
LFKPSIRLVEHNLVRKPEISPTEDSPVLAPRTPLRKDGLVLASEVNSGAFARPIDRNVEPEGEIVAIVRPPNLKVD